MGEGREIKLHACRRKPSGLVVGEVSGSWALIEQETPLSPPRRSGTKGGGLGGISVLFNGRVLADGINYCPYCGETLSGKDGKK